MPSTLKSRIRAAARRVGKTDLRGCLSCKGKMVRKMAATVSAGRALVVTWGKKSAMPALAASLHVLGYDVETIERGEGDWKDAVIDSIRNDPPDIFLCWQRLYDHGWSKEVKGVLDEYMIPQLYVDFGIWPHYRSVIFDPMGENATSQVAGALRGLDASEPYRSAANNGSAEILRAMRLGLAAHAARAENQLANLGLDGLPKHFSLAILQRTGDQVLRFDAVKKRREPLRLLNDLIAEAKKQRQYIVIKAHPFDKKMDLSGVKMSGRYWRVLTKETTGDNDAAMAWLVREADYAIMVNSTSHLTCLAMGTPVVTLGKGWFTGNEVTSEFKTIRGAVAGPKDHDEQLRERYLLHMLSRQLPLPACKEAPRIASTIDMLTNRKASTRDITTITTIYADKDAEEGVRETLVSIMKSLPGMDHIAAVDKARPNFMREIEALGFRLITMDEGSPPRMISLLKKALDGVTTRYALTVEQDVIINKDTVAGLLARMRAVGADIAGVESTYETREGKLTFPTTSHFRNQLPTGQAHVFTDKSHICWACTLWRADALRSVSWNRVPVLGHSDVEIGRRLRAKGYRLIRDHSVRCIHLVHQGIRAYQRDAARAKDPLPTVLKRSSARGDVVMATAAMRAVALLNDTGTVSVETQCPDVLRNNPDVIPGRGRGRVASLDWSYEEGPWDHAILSYFQAAGVSARLTPELMSLCRPKVYPSRHMRHVAAKALPDDQQWAVLHPGPCRWPERTWNRLRWHKLADDLRSRGYAICVLYDKAVSSMVSADVFRDDSDTLQCAAIIERAALFVGIDSGPSHLAQAMKRPSVILFGPITPKTRLHSLVDPSMSGTAIGVEPEGVECAGCGEEQPRRNGRIFCYRRKRPSECMEGITLASVVAAVDRAEALKPTEPSESSKVREKVLPYLRGRGLDVGSGQHPILPEAISIDVRQLPQVDLAWAHMDALPIPDDWCDYVFSSHCLEHLKDPEAAIAEWRRVLKPGGYLALYLPDQPYTEENAEHLHKLSMEAIMPWLTGFDLVHQAYCFDYSFMVVAKKLKST